VTPWLIALAAVIFFAVLGTVAHASNRRYRSEILRWAEDGGWTYRNGGGGKWTSLLPRGNGRRGVSRQLDGTRKGRPVTVAHYTYETTSPDTQGYGTSTTTHTLTVIVVGLAARYPAVALEHRGRGLGLGLALSQATGLKPANLSGTGEFDRRYRIRAGAADASTLITPQVISAYLTRDLPPWQLSDDHLVITWPGPIRADDIDQKIGKALAVADLVDSPARRP
jgi:hypothetical protein